MPRAVSEMDRHGLGALIIIDESERLVGIFTDGDLRRMIARGEPILDASLATVMTPSPRCVMARTPAYDALNTMEQFEITVLPVVDNRKKVIGILHLHDILGKGEFKFNGHAPDDQATC